MSRSVSARTSSNRAPTDASSWPTRPTASSRVRRAGELQEFGEHAALGGLVLGDVVVQLLADGERPGQLRLGLVERLLEAGDRLLAVLRAGVGQVQLGGLDRLVEGQQLLAGPE